MPLLFGIVGLFLLLLSYFASNHRTEGIDEGKIQILGNDDEAISTGNIIVDIQGEVENPGVYELSAGKRIADLIEMAGGFTSEADDHWVAHQLNQAELLKDG